MSNILVRALSGAVFVIVVIGSLYYHTYSALICLGLFTLLGLTEFYGLFKRSEKASASLATGTVQGMYIFVTFSLAYVSVIPWIFAALSVPLLFAGMLAELWRKQENPILNLGVQYFGLFYVVLPFLAMFFMEVQNKYFLIYMFLLIWSNDTFAFLTGKMMGKTKLFERISPNKTWEGTVGGIVMTIGVSVVISYVTDGEYAFWIPAAFLIAASAIFGDLLESLFKRSLNIKDSGNIMPGHGGILDRFDAALLAAPIFLCWWLFYTYFCINFI